MVTALILSGGTGTRLGSNIPKQYIEVGGKPIIMHGIERFQKNDLVDQMIIVAADEWKIYIKEWLDSNKISKFIGFATAGSSRQHSILNGIKVLASNGFDEKDIVIIHDAARPNVSNLLISNCIDKIEGADGVMPVLPTKDTIYYSEEGIKIDSLMEREKLYVGQAPECFNLKKYYEIHENLTEDELALIRGSSEIAYRNGLSVKLIKGDEYNYKITTMFDLERFKLEIEEKTQNESLFFTCNK